MIRPPFLPALALTLAGLPLAAQSAPLKVASAPVRRALDHLLAQREALGLNPLHDFVVQGAHQDELGMTHVRFQQTFQGVKVEGGEVIAHLDAEGALRPLTANHWAIPSLNIAPGLTPTEALAQAHRALAPQGPYAHPPTVELVIAPTTVEVPARRLGLRRLQEPSEPTTEALLRASLAYHVHTELENGAETAHTDFLIHAHTGAVLERWSTLHTTGASGTGNSQYSGTVSLATNSTGSGYELRDTTRGSGGTFGNNVVTNLNHATSGNGTIYTDADNTWGDGANYTEGGSTTAANGQTAAVDAGFGAQRTWDYYGNIHARSGIDGLGTATFSRVHYSNAYDNAFWSDTCFCMTYGDGSSFLTLTAIDVAGHEMSHGVTSRTANLRYSGEPGGLNEATSDINGTMVEFYLRGGGTSTVPNYTAIGGTLNTVAGPVPVANYLIGEQLETASFPEPLRTMYKPSLDGASPDFWSRNLKSLDVHYSSGVANHFFFLLAHGSQVDAFSGNIQSPMTNGITSVTGIGNDKAARIWYRALTVYMTSRTAYSGARTATLSAAKDLYGASSAEYATVATAWTAVNVK
ncbi:MAG TPA: M4 family metallopeptidase [Holophagaceae bacterium]|nr:M4 family metallopeptidase [Holophagaceae bacterium]